MFPAALRCRVAGVCLLALLALSCGKKAEKADPELRQKARAWAEPSQGAATAPQNASTEPSETRLPFLLHKGEALHVQVEQKGVDLALFLEDTRAKRRIEIDSPNGDQGLEWMDWIAEETGTHYLVLRTLSGDGQYQIRRSEHRQPTRRDLARAAATHETADGLADLRAHRAAEAEAHFAKAARLWGRISATDTERLTTYQRWAAAAERNAHYSRALEALDRAAPIARALRLPRVAADIANSRAAVFYRQSDFQQCLTAASAALSLAKKSGFATVMAVAHGNLGLCYQGLGRFDSAISQYELSRKQWLELQRPEALGILRLNLGTLFNATARWQEAADTFREALVLVDPTDQRTLAATRNGLALSLFQLGEKEWPAELAKALAIQRTIHDRQGQVRTLDRMANLAVEKEDFDEAEARFDEALRIYKDLDDPLGKAYTLANRAHLEIRRGHSAASLNDLVQALPIFDRYEDVIGKGYGLLLRAEAQRALGRLPEAFTDAELAIALVEGQRLQVPEPLSRMTFLDPRIWFFDTYVDVAMDLHASSPSAGHDKDALLATERARGRGLLDLLATRYGSPSFKAKRYFVPQSFENLDILREDGTLYLIYYFSSTRGYLWSLGPDGLHTFDLGPAHTLESEVRETYALLAENRGRRSSITSRLASLSRRLLPPTALEGNTQRLVVVGDGPIRYLPFALLPSPIDGAPLVKSLEISLLPSLSVLAALRRAPAAKDSATHQVAVIADPLLAPPSRRSRGGVARAVEGLGLRELPALPYSRVEAERLLNLTPPGSRLALLGPSARRDLIATHVLGPYRYIHFATHSLFDPKDVHHSGLVLSQLDAEGHEIEGFLSFDEIEKLRLRADLVVASACETAMGRDLRGEGPVGVSQAFLAAGAKRTLGSLWRINDRTTADFMSSFYDALLVEGLTPTAALRKTQLKFLESDPKSRRPNWAAFVLIGEYL